MADLGDFAARVQASQHMGGAAIQQRPFVPLSEEFKRVFSLPWRDWEHDDRLPLIAEALTQRLKTPEGTQSLWLSQASVLADALQHRGAVSGQKMGEGKTLVTYLMPVWLDAQRPLLLVPGKLEDDTRMKFDALSRHWRRHPRYEIRSYSWLSNKKNAEFLEEYQPDCVCADEGRVFSNQKNACTARMKRHLQARACALIILSATLFSDASIMDFHHLLRWCLGPTKIPLPASTEEASLWARALDVKVKEEDRVELGAFYQFVPTREEMRSALGRMINQTPGITITSKPGVEASLHISTWSDVQIPYQVSLFMKQAWEGRRPDGREIAGTDVPKINRELSQGFWYDHDPMPPDEWFARRKAFKSVVWAVSEGRDDVDTEGQVIDMIRSGKCGGQETLAAWDEAQRLYPTNLVVRWIDTFLIHEILKKTVEFEGRPVLIWVVHRAMGFALASEGNMSFYHQRGRDQNGRHINDDAGTTCALSSNAMREGYNLQDRWSDNIIVVPQPSGEINDQLLARTHRNLQKRAIVTAEYLTHTQQAMSSLMRAREAAKGNEQFSGSQRLLMADWITERNRAGSRG